MLNPVGRTTELEPVQTRRLHASTAQNEIQVTIAIEVRQRRQSVVADAVLGYREVSCDKMVLEKDFGSDAIPTRNEKHPGE
jgi:hypothetical protein